MPLMDHFRMPMRRRFPYTALHSAWATYLATNLVQHWMPKPFTAIEHTHQGTEIEIDVSAYDTSQESETAAGDGTVAVGRRTWTAPRPRAVAPLEFSHNYEVLVYTDEDGWQLVGAIELVSPKNKDRPDRRQAFVGKCAGLLHRGVSVVILDVVTERRANLHNQLMRAMEMPDETVLGPRVGIYVSAYRPVERDERTELEVWAEPYAVGRPVPTMPLRLTGDLIVPVEFEATYHQICVDRGLI